ncbi:MAG: hypothetical protein HZA83_03205 [Thaumarchaeota archaeon]|nr:hypothetical protein [Nitrososphaerota archaeon]
MAQNQINPKQFAGHVRGLASNGTVPEPDATNLIVALNRAKARAEQGRPLLLRLIAPATIPSEDAICLTLENIRGAEAAASLSNMLGIPVLKPAPVQGMKDIDALATSLPALRIRLREKHDEADSTMEFPRRTELFAEADQLHSHLLSRTKELLSYCTTSDPRVRDYATAAAQRDIDLLSAYLSSLSNELYQINKQAEMDGNDGMKHMLTVKFQHLEGFYSRVTEQIVLYAQSGNSQVALHAIKAIEEGRFDPEILYGLTLSRHNDEVRIQALESLLNLFKQVADDSTPQRIRHSILERVVHLTMSWNCPEFFNARATEAIRSFLISEEAKKPASQSRASYIEDYVDFILSKLIRKLLFEMPYSAIPSGKADSETLLKSYERVKDMLKSAALRSTRVADSLAHWLLPIDARETHDASDTMLFHRTWGLGLELIETAAQITRYRQLAITTLEGLPARIRSWPLNRTVPEMAKYDGPYTAEPLEKEEAIARINETVARLKTIRN